MLLFCLLDYFIGATTLKPNDEFSLYPLNNAHNVPNTGHIR